MSRQKFITILMVITPIFLISGWYFGVSYFQQTERPVQVMSSQSIKAANPKPQIDDVVATGEFEPLRKSQEQVIFAEILNSLKDCLQLEKIEVPNQVPLSIEGLLTILQPELGPPIRQEDQSMIWHLRSHEGRVRQIRLEVSEDENGHSIKQLKYFAVDREDQPIPMQISTAQSVNPSDEVIQTFLKEGNVFFKEKSGFINFAGGEKIDFLETDGVLSQIEANFNGASFSCRNLISSDSCACFGQN